MKVGILAAALLLCAGSHIDADPLLKLRVSPALSAAPATVRIRLTVAPDVANRAVTVSAVSEDFVRSSQVPLEGDQAPRTIFVEYPSLPAGQYEVRGVVVGSHGEALAMARAGIIVTGVRR